MIRINLLPVRQGKKREMGRQYLVVAVGLVLIALIGNWFWYNQLATERDRNQARIDDTRKRISELEKVIGEVNNINKRRKEVEDKLAVLEKLRRGRSGPVRMLDALSTATPKKVFVTEFEEKSSSVKLIGKASSHDDVADFMRGLSAMVWTPKGMGRVVERKRDSPTVRVELLTTEGAMEDFTLAEVAPFFSSIDLKKAESKDDKVTHQVTFEIGMLANYTL
ncbi:MAG: PilN domain-containing protein [Archangiaceae bacterium]|nr:PilN domain-containing protein [Archangiaceae bacterium]